MNSLVSGILSLKGDQLDSLIEVLLLLLLIGAYIIPLVIIIYDLRKRYSDRILRTLLTFLAIFGLPLFIVPYILFRKETTLKEDISINSEIDILTATNNCIKCNKCSEINRSDYNYCIKCGNLLIALCKNCSQNIDLNWSHCAFCGIALKNTPLILEHITETKKEIPLENPETIGFKTFNTSFLKNKKIIYAIGHKLNSLITPSSEVYKQ